MESFYNLPVLSGVREACRCSVLRCACKLGRAKMTSRVWLRSKSLELLGVLIPALRALSDGLAKASGLSRSTTGKRSTAEVINIINASEWMSYKMCS